MGYGRQNSTGEYRSDGYRCDGHSHGFIAVIEQEVQAVVGLGQDPEPVLIGIE